MPILKNRVFLIAAGIVLVLVLVIAIAGILLSRNKEVGERHSPGNYTEEDFDFSSGSFADYIAWSQRHLREARGDGDEVISNLAPFRLEPGGDNCPASSSADKPLNGIVLTHGLLDSPYLMRDMGEYFQSRCFLVLGVLLPGHGTRPGDLLHADWADWAEVESFAARELAKEVDRVYLGGYSEGGTLAILEAAAGDTAISGLVLLAPVLEAGKSAWYDWLVAPLSRLFPKAGWVSIMPDDALYNYESYTYSAGREANALVGAVRSALSDRPLAIPVFSVASVEDNKVRFTAVLDFMAGLQPHPLSKTLLYSQHEIAARPGVIVQNSDYSDEGLLSLSHKGLTLPLYHVYYGWEGDYRDCAHYYQSDKQSYDRCKAGEREFYGEITPENLQQGLLEHMGSNAFYSEMLQEIDGFIAPGVMFLRKQPH